MNWPVKAGSRGGGLDLMPAACAFPGGRQKRLGGSWLRSVNHESLRKGDEQDVNRTKVTSATMRREIKYRDLGWSSRARTWAGDPTQYEHRQQISGADTSPNAYSLPSFSECIYCRSRDPSKWPECPWCFGHAPVRGALRRQPWSEPVARSSLNPVNGALDAGRGLGRCQFGIKIVAAAYGAHLR